MKLSRIGLLFFGIILCIGFTKPLSAQKYYTIKTAPSKAVDFFKNARKAAYNNDRETAKKEAKKALKSAPGFIEALYLIADIQVVEKDYENANQNFEKILQLAPDYKPKVMFTYGIALLEQKKYTKAAEILERFLTYPQKSDRTVNRAKKLIGDAKFIETALKNPVPFNPVNLGPEINSNWSEYWPSISIDGEAFIFTRQSGNNEDFFVSKKEEENWQKAYNIGAPINTPQNEGAQTVSADGRFFAYTVCNRPGDFGKCDLYYSEMKNNKWTTPKNMGATINSAQWESQPSLSADGNTLFFTRGTDNRDKNKDIWFSTRSANGDWVEPQKLGESINTVFSDEGPFIHPDGQTLYFISNGHPGMGGSDVYLSRKQEDGSWGKAQNLGYPINTEKDEYSIIVGLNGELAYFSSDREGGFGRLDIYSFEMHEEGRPKPVTYVEAKVFDVETKEVLEANLELNILESGKVHLNGKTDAEGMFLVCLPSGVDYALNVSKEGYLFHSENFALKEIHSLTKPFQLEIGLIKIPVKESKPEVTITEKPKPRPVILRNVFFETGSASLKPASITELNKLRDLLNNHSNMAIQLNGHTDNVGSETDNLNLSQRRADAVKNFLIKEGINGNRLKTKGFGETQPIDSNETKQGRASNRRTEFIILN